MRKFAGGNMFKNAVKIFSLNRFDIKVDPSWLLIAALITWSLSQQYFPTELPGQSTEIYMVMAIITMLCFFGSLLLHELAHSVVARKKGVPIKSITLFLFGGVAELKAEPQSARAEFWIALAGPAMSLALAFGFWVLAKVAELALITTPVTVVLSYLALINLVLAIFNMVPAFPLDGGRVLRAFLWHRDGDMLKATETAAKSGAIFAYMLMGLGLLSLFQGLVVAGIWQLLIGGFVLFASRNSYQSQLMRATFEGKTVEDLMTKDPVCVDPETTLAELVNRIMLQYRISFVPVVDGQVLLGHIDTTVLRGIDSENWANTHVGDVFAALERAVAVRPDLPVQDLMSQIAKTGRRKFLVAENHRLLGVITLADLTGYLNITDVLRHGRGERR